VDHTGANQWVEINAEAIIQNLREVKSILKEQVRLIAVVKANAYGHGAAGTASILESQGVDFFAVTYLPEALKLRRAGIKSDIMLLSPLISDRQIQEAVDNDITLTLSSKYDAQLVNQAVLENMQTVKAHLKIETGLGRFGMDTEEALEICRILADNALVKLEGIYTHMAEAVSASSCQQQFGLFSATIDQLASSGYNFPLQHCANSAAAVLYPHMQMNAVRSGTLLAGQYPVGVQGEMKLRDPFKFKCRVISLTTHQKGSTLGYYRTYRLKMDAQIAVIPAGYIHGLALEVGNQPAGLVDLLKIVFKTILAYLGVHRFSKTVLIGGKSYPVRGKVFMQMAMVEIPSGETIAVGNEVEVPVRKTLVAESVPRFYRYKDQIISEDELNPDQAAFSAGREYA